MLDFRPMKNFVVLGGGTVGWLAALELRKALGDQVSITVIESRQIAAIEVAAGAALNLPPSLERYGVSVDAFVQAAGATIKLGTEYVGWNDASGNDVFRHLFCLPPIHNGTALDMIALNWAGLAANGISVQYAIPSLPFILNNASQANMRNVVLTSNPRMPVSLHFDTHRAANYLKQIAAGQGIRSLEARVQQLKTDPATGHVTALEIEGHPALALDFLIDASGFARIALEQTYKVPLRRFNDYLLPDRALTFHLPHPRENPHLVTRAVAMNAGWMWQTPLQERVGCGYVFSSAHLDEDAALAEIEARVGMKVEAAPAIRFESGHLENAWVGNVMAVGLACGFIEPLAGAPIGQMLRQIQAFCNAVVGCAHVVPQSSIDSFNERNRRDWANLLDFTSLHYDVKRRDTAFWRDATAQRYSSAYAELKACWQRRIPLSADLNIYTPANALPFAVTSWLMAGQGTGVIPAQVSRQELSRLPRETAMTADTYAADVKARFGL